MSRDCPGCGSYFCDHVACYLEEPADEETTPTLTLADLRKAHPEWVEAAKEDQLTQTLGDPLQPKRRAA